MSRNNYCIPLLLDPDDKEPRLFVDFTNLVNTIEGMEEKYKKRISKWNNIFNSDELMIDISKDETELRISWFKDMHFRDEKILSVRYEDQDLDE